VANLLFGKDSHFRPYVDLRVRVSFVDTKNFPKALVRESGRGTPPPGPH
jgi:hypothetical protein